MQELKQKFVLQSIRNKVLIAFLFGCIVVVISWTIAQLVFRETFQTIDVISAPDPKLGIVNRLFQKIHRLDQGQKYQLLTLKTKPDPSFLGESDQVVRLLDSLEFLCLDDSLQIKRLTRMKKILKERDQLFLNYLQFRYETLRQNKTSESIRSLKNIVRNNATSDSAVVKTTRKSITTSTVLDLPVSLEKVKKRASFFRRVFGKKKTNKVIERPRQKLITEKVYITVDTFAVQQRDSFIKDMEKAINGIEKDRYARRSKVVDHEVKLLSASSVFIDELEQLLRQVQQEEILYLQTNTNSLSEIFNRAFDGILFILGVFLALVVILVFLILFDISKTSKIQKQLAEAKEKAEYLEQVKHRFLANMSHEIRTPLQSIIGYSEQIQNSNCYDKKSLNVIHKSAEYLLQIVNEVLDYSRIVSGKFVIEEQIFNMNELIAEVLDTMGVMAENNYLRFTFSSQLSDGLVYQGDPFRLRQVLYNVIGNAIKFTQHGEVSITVLSKELTPETTEFTFRIKDSGVGMTDAELKKVFVPFEQAENSTHRQYGGTGLGLSIVKDLVGLMRGTVSVKSEQHVGTCFEITIPFTKVDAGLFHGSELPDQLAAHFKGKVLVVDDDEFILQLCSSILQKHQINFTCVSSPNQLLNASWDDQLTLALLDIRMPDVGGVELLQHLKSLAGPRVSFVALTAQALPEEKIALIEQGFDALLLKPFRELDLISLLAGNTNVGESPLATDHFNLTSIAKLSVGDRVLFQKNLDVFVQQTLKDLSLLENSLRHSQFRVVGEVCHRLSSKAGQVGLHLLSEQFRVIEHAVRKNENEEPDKKLMNELIKQMKMVVEKIESGKLSQQN